MNKSILSILLLSILLIGYFPIIRAQGFPTSYNSKQLIVDTIGEPESLDPAWAYDTSSGEVIMNVYETLLFFARDYTQGPYSAGLVNAFEPKLATSWTVSTSA